MPTVTALRDDRRGRVVVELDGAVWRTLPADVVVRAGLAEGRALDRPALRVVRRELRRAEALALAGRALQRRNLSSHELALRLEPAAVRPETAAETLDVLTRAGFIDDARFGHGRAQALAERGYSDAAIRHDLEGRGLSPALIDEALAALGAESERARRLVERRGPGPKTARYLAARGFGDEALEAALDARFANDP